MRASLPGPSHGGLPEGAGHSLLLTRPMENAFPVETILEGVRRRYEHFPQAHIDVHSVRAWDHHLRRENRTGDVVYPVYDRQCWLVTVTNIDFYGHGLGGDPPNHECNELFDQATGEWLGRYSFR